LPETSLRNIALNAKRFDFVYFWQSADQVMSIGVEFFFVKFDNIFTVPDAAMKAGHYEGF
jgi:hypothetical protein